MGIDLGIDIGPFELGSKTYGSTGTDDFAVGQLY